MKISIWPEPHRKTIVSIFLLATVLIAAVLFTLGVKAVGKAGEVAYQTGINIVLGKLFDQSLGKTRPIVPIPTQLDSSYGLSLMQEESIGHRCQDFYNDRGYSPISLTELVPYGIPAAGNFDPWGRPYRIHKLAPQLLTVQSTGPSGVDRVDWENLKFNGATQSKAFMVDDNLLVVIVLSDHHPLNSN